MWRGENHTATVYNKYWSYVDFPVSTSDVIDCLPLP
jgi:hypothetical protein